MRTQTGAATLPRRTPQFVVIVALAVLLSAASFQSAWAQIAPSLGQAESFAVLGGSTVINTGSSTAAESHGVVFTALCAADETLGLPAPGRECYVQLVGRGRAHLLRSLIKALRRSRSLPPAGFLTLRYASFNNRQRFRSAQRSAMHWPGRQLTARELAEGALPGQ
jgi:hypothetical protein